ncbi:MFS transporter [Candidatus Methylomirabilis sp.]|uniref:MFS transporter n=1 Tax=Candidatus Methylomirabilis sp. TaxID=2032687 RepID=UPI003076504C
MRVPSPIGAWLDVLKMDQTCLKGLRAVVNPLARSQIDIALLFATRIMRLFAYGFLSVVLALYLEQVGLSEQAIGVLLTLTLVGDAGISLWITTSADRIGRRRMLVLGAALMILAGVVFISTGNPLVLTIAAILGVISPSGNEIGPFLSIEQAALSQLLPHQRRTQVFAWYNLVGSFATASGALSGGWLAHTLQGSGVSPLESYRVVLIGYALGGVALACSFLCLSPSVETTAHASPAHRTLGLHRSRQVVMKLSALFALDAFAGGFVVQSLLAYWFHITFGIDVGLLGSIFFGANILAGISALLAARIAARIGLINTMVFTHIPSNVLLCLVPLMPTLPLAIGVLLLRFSISQMDVPTRQSYTMAVVAPDERSAASGVTAIARSVGASLSPALSGLFLATPSLIGAPFLVAGGLKIVYDVLLYRSFRGLKSPEE